MTKKIDLKTEIQYWREQCNILKKDVRVLRRELYWEQFYGKNKYEEFKDWVVKNHSDVWIVRDIFDAFEKKYDDAFDNVYQENEKLKSRIEYLERKIERERNATNKQYEKWEKEALEKINKLEKDNAFLTVEVEALGQIKPIRKLPRELTVLKLDDGDVK